MPTLYEPYVGKAWVDTLRNFAIYAILVLVSGKMKSRQCYDHASDIILLNSLS